MTTPNYADVREAMHARILELVPEIKRAESAKDLLSALTSAGNAPAALTLTGRSESPGRLTHNSKQQVEATAFIVVVITESFASEDDATKENEALQRLIKIALVGWEPPGAQNGKGLVFRGASFFAGMGTRVAHQMRFETKFWSDYKP